MSQNASCTDDGVCSVKPSNVIPATQSPMTTLTDPASDRRPRRGGAAASSHAVGPRATGRAASPFPTPASWSPPVRPPVPAIAPAPVATNGTQAQAAQAAAPAPAADPFSLRPQGAPVGLLELMRMRPQGAAASSTSTDLTRTPTAGAAATAQSVPHNPLAGASNATDTMVEGQRVSLGAGAQLSDEQVTALRALLAGTSAKGDPAFSGAMPAGGVGIPASGAIPRPGASWRSCCMKRRVRS